MNLAPRRRLRRIFTAALAAFGLFGLAGSAAARCQLTEAGELHVIMDGNRPLVPGVINGHSVMMLIDTGASFSSILRSAVPTLGLRPLSVDRVHVYGVGGETRVEVTDLSQLKIDHFNIVNPELLVVGERPFDRPEVVAIIGMDFLSKWDLEFDLPDGMIRLLTPKDCQGDQVIYWGGAYAEAPLLPSGGLGEKFIIRVMLNRSPTEATLDSGAYYSTVTLAAARAAGVTPTSEGVVASGASHGVGADAAQTWIAAFDSFSIGDETIKNPRIHISDMFASDVRAETGSRIPREVEGLPSMLLGADFLRTHRVMLANSQHMAYFTYVGGDPFGPAGPRLRRLPTSAQAAPALTPQPAAAPSSTSPK